MLPLSMIVSLISIFVVTGVATTVYVQATKQRDVYNRRLAEVVGKTNSANQYEFEKNKDQEVSLDRVRGDVVKFDGQILGVNKSLENVKAEYGGRIADMSSTMTNVNQQVTKTLGAIQSVSEKQSDSIALFKETLGKTTGEVKTLNSQMAIVNGKLVNIGEKQQTAIDSLLLDTKSMKTEQGDLRDYVYKNQNDTASAITSQNNTISGFQSTTTDRMVKQDEQITKAYNVAKSVQNLVTTLDTAIENLRAKFNDYVSKTDIVNYATKNDINSVNNTFKGYVSTTDFTTYKNSLPLLYTAQEMDILKKSFVTTTDIQSFINLLNQAQLTVNSIKAITDTLPGTYATKSDLLAISGNVAQETINIGSLSTTLSGLQTQVNTINNSVAGLNNTFSTFQNTTAPNTYAKISYVNTEIQRLQGLITALTNTTSWILTSLTVNGSFTATGDSVLLNDIKMSKNYTGYPESANDKSEISNDINLNKKLLLVGNKSAGTGKREVGVWDNLTVNGDVTTSAGSVSAANVKATGQMMIGANGDKGWFKSDGTGFVQGNFGVGVPPSDVAFNNGAVAGAKQMVVRGGTTADWQAQFINPNGNRSIYMNHGTGNGMQINTNDSTAAKYALQTTNSTTGNKTFEVVNDGTINTFGTLKVYKPDPGAILEVNYDDNKTDFRYGVGQWPNGVVRTYAGNRVGSVNMSVADLNGTFRDVVKVDSTGLTVNDANNNAKASITNAGAITGTSLSITSPGVITGNVPATNISGTLGVGVGGTGTTSFNSGSVLVGGTTVTSPTQLSWDGNKLNANAPVGATFPSGWGGNASGKGVMTFDVYSAGGTLAAGDAAGNVKASINKDGIVSADNTLCIKDVCVTYDDFKKVKAAVATAIPITALFGMPSYFWEGAFSIPTSGGIVSKFTMVGAPAPGTYYYTIVWYGRYMITFTGLSVTNALPTNYARFTLPIDPSTHNSVFFSVISGDRWSNVTAWICNASGVPQKKLQTRCTTTGVVTASYLSSYVNPQNNTVSARTPGTYHEWVQIGIPKSFIDLYKTATNEINIAFCCGANNGETGVLYVSGVATCPNPYGFCSTSPKDISWPSNGGGSVVYHSDNDNGESLCRFDPNVTYPDFRIPIVDETKDLIIGFINYHNTITTALSALNSMYITVPNTNNISGYIATTQYKISQPSVGIFAKNLLSRNYAVRFPTTFIIPAAAVAAGFTNDGNGNKQIKISLVNLGPETIYMRGFYSEIYNGF